MRERVVVIGDELAARAISRFAGPDHDVHAVPDAARAIEALERLDAAAVVVAADDPGSAGRAGAALASDPTGQGTRRPCALLAVSPCAVDAALRLCEQGLFDDYLVLDAGADPHRPALVLRHALERRRLRDSIAERLDQIASIRRDIGESGSRIGRRIVADGGDPTSVRRIAVDLAGAFARADLALGGCARALGAVLEPVASDDAARR